MSTRERKAKEIAQKRIDVSNLRFYANEAAERKWSTGIIDHGVIVQTLREIANRMAYEVAEAELGDKP